MKKFLFGALALTLTCTAISSCMETEADHASATVTYEGYVDSIQFANEDDTIYTKAIRDLMASKAVGLSDSCSQFQESTKVQNTSNVYFAYWICDSTAQKTYQKMLNSKDAEYIFTILDASYRGPHDIKQLQSFTVHFGLYRAPAAIESNSMKKAFPRTYSRPKVSPDAN